MIKASNFTLDRIKNNLVARCDISGTGLPKSLWFAAECDDTSALEIDEPNWAAVALIYPAMGLGQDLVIDAKISPRLLYNLNNDFQHLMRAFFPKLKNIRVIADSGRPKVYADDVNRHAITGYSGGVDSSATFALYSGKEVPESMRISALSVYDVGALGRTPKNPSFEKLQPHFDKLKRFCDSQQVDALGIASNMNQVFQPVSKLNPNISIFPGTVSLRNTAATMAMQTRVKNYYPSGNSGFGDVNVTSTSTIENFESILDLLLSTETLHIQAGGGGLDRSEKIKLISKTDFAQAGLDVCVVRTKQRAGINFTNCGWCWKCILTQFQADAIGVLSSYSKVFDTKEFFDQKDEKLSAFLESGFYADLYAYKELNDIAKLYQSHGRDVPTKLEEAVLQLSSGEPVSIINPEKVKKSRLARIMAKLR